VCKYMYIYIYRYVYIYVYVFVYIYSTPRKTDHLEWGTSISAASKYTPVLCRYQCAQPERPFWRMHATDFWATDARKVLGQFRMRATYIPDARNPFNCKPLPWVELPCQQSDTSQSFVRGVSCKLVCSSHSTLQHVLVALWLIDVAFITS